MKKSNPDIAPEIRQEYDNCEDHIQAIFDYIDDLIDHVPDNSRSYLSLYEGAECLRAIYGMLETIDDLQESIDDILAFQGDKL